VAAAETSFSSTTLAIFLAIDVFSFLALVIIVLVKEGFPIDVEEVFFHTQEKKSCPILAHGIVATSNLACQPSLVVGDGGELGLAQRHHPQSIGAWGLMHTDDVKFVNPRLERFEQLERGLDARQIHGLDVVNVKGKQTVGDGVGILADTVLEAGALSNNGRQILLALLVYAAKEGKLLAGVR
jgi:hypothetical protein